MLDDWHIQGSVGTRRVKLYSLPPQMLSGSATASIQNVRVDHSRFNVAI